MKVLVPVKRVIDYNVKVRVRADGSGVELAGSLWADERATRSGGRECEG